MAIISFDRNTPVNYVPEYAGNRDSKEPCIVKLKFVPYERVQYYRRLMEAKNKGVSDPVRMMENDQMIQRQQFVESVESVSGYSVNGKEITDPGEFYDTADIALITEILVAMISTAKLNEGQRKN